MEQPLDSGFVFEVPRDLQGTDGGSVCGDGKRRPERRGLHCYSTQPVTQKQLFLSLGGGRSTCSGVLQLPVLGRVRDRTQTPCHIRQFGSPVRERAVRQRTQTDRGDLADDEDEYSMDLGAAASEQNDDDPADDGPPSEAVVRAELEAEKARFATIPMRELQAALVRNEFNVLRFFAFHKDKYPVHYEMALVIYGVVLNEANVERVFSFSSNTLHDKRTRLGATVFEAFVVVGLNFTSEVMDPELIEEILNEYYDTADTSGDHDCDDPPDDREEDQDDEPADQDPDADFELGNGGAAAAAAATDGAAGGGAAVANAIVMATPG